MATDDAKNTDDLLSRRMSSGSEPADAAGSRSRTRSSHGRRHIGEHVADDATFSGSNRTAGSADAADSAGFTDSAGSTASATTADSAGLTDSADAAAVDDPSNTLNEETVEFDPIAHRNEELRNRAFADSEPGISHDDEPTQRIAAGAAPAGSAPAGSVHHRNDTSLGEDTGRRRANALDIIGGIWIAIATPFVLAGLAVRFIASGLFLTFEYFWRPGFPADSYGFTTDDRLHYGSYVVDYLNNFDSGRYLSDVVLPNGVPLFQPEEIAHMEDVKALISLLYLVAVLGAIGAVAFGLYMSRRSGPGLRSALRFGALLTIIAFLILAVLAMLGWERFFTQFHALFFTSGTWEFYLNDALIRLFPGPFWIDAGIAAALIVLLISAALLVLSFLGRSRADRREHAAERRAARNQRRAEKQAERQAERTERAETADVTSSPAAEAEAASGRKVTDASGAESSRTVTIRRQEPEDPSSRSRD